MKKLTVVQKLWFLSAQLLLNILAVGVLANWLSSSLADKAVRLADRDYPLLKDAILIDMMHDGIMGTVYRGVHEQSMGQDLGTVKSDLDEMTANIEQYYKTIGENLPTDSDAEVRAHYDSVQPALVAYKAQAKQVIELLTAARRDEALAMLPKFSESFSELEVTLEKFGEDIEQLIKGDVANAKETADFAGTVNFWLQILSLGAGFAGAFFVIRSLVRTMRDSTTGLEAESVQLIDAVNQVNSSTQQLSEASTEQSAAVEETAASMEEMAAMIKQTANSAQETQRGASEAKSRATDGKRSVDELVSAMREISSTNDKLGGLDKVITDIEAKTRIINDIAFETKLLAFNASIEAARAGAHGRGFAVVSDEVGKLAATSNKAADEVRELLESSHAAVDAIISETRTKVEHGQTKTKLCADAFSAMENSLVAIADSVNEIANAAKEQMSGVSQTNSAMQEMEKATRQNAASSEFLARLASDLFTRSKKFESASLDLRRAVLGNARGSSLQQGEALVDTTAATNNGVKADTNQSAQDLRPAPGSNTETPLKIVKGENAESAAEIDRDDSRWKAA